MSFVQQIGLILVFFVIFDTLHSYQFDKFLELEEIYSYMADLCRCSNYVKILTIGETYENRQIKVLKIDIDTGYCREKKAIAVEAGARPKAWTAIATAIYIMEQLVKSNNSNIKYLAKQYVWYIVPVLNPDGYVYTWKKERGWMFNRQPYGKCIGADLTTNFPFRWNYFERNENDCEGQFTGDYPLSEIETQAWVTLLLDIKEPLHGYFELWTDGSKLWYPLLTDHKFYENWKSHTLQAAKVFKHKHGTKIKIYSCCENVNGESFIWASKNFESLCLAYRYNTRGGLELPPNQIIPAADELFDSMVSLIFQAEPRRSDHPIIEGLN